MNLNNVADLVDRIGVEHDQVGKHGLSLDECVGAIAKVRSHCHGIVVDQAEWFRQLKLTGPVNALLEAKVFQLHGGLAFVAAESIVLLSSSDDCDLRDECRKLIAFMRSDWELWVQKNEPTIDAAVFAVDAEGESMGGDSDVWSAYQKVWHCGDRFSGALVDLHGASQFANG